MQQNSYIYIYEIKAKATAIPPTKSRAIDYGVDPSIETQNVSKV